MATTAAQIESGRRFTAGNGASSDAGSIADPATVIRARLTIIRQCVVGGIATIRTARFRRKSSILCMMPKII